MINVATGGNTKGRRNARRDASGKQNGKRLLKIGVQ